MDNLFNIMVCFTIGCYIISGVIVGWVYLSISLKSLRKHLKRSYDPMQDYKNPLRR